MLDDEIGDMQAVDIPVVSSGVNIAQYRKRVESFIKSNEDHITIAKLKRGLALTPTDLSELERFVLKLRKLRVKKNLRNALVQISHYLSLFVHLSV